MAGWPPSLRTLTDLLLAVPQPMFIAWGPNCTLIYNDGYTPILSCKHPAALGQRLLDVCAEARDLLAPLVDRVFAGEPAHMEEVALTLERQGRPEEAHFAFSYTPVRDEAGVVQGLFCSCTETTAKVALLDLNADLERQVQERARGRGRIWQISPDLLSVISPDGSFAATNPAWQVTLGWSADELACMPWPRLVHPADLERSHAAFAVVLRGDPVLRFENRYRCKFGGYRWLSWVAVPEGDRFYCRARDVTHEREQAVELAARTAELDRVWRNSPDLLVAIGVNGIFHAVNPAWTAILGHDPADVVGRSFLDFVWPDDASMTQHGLATAASKQDLTNFENRYRHKDGTPRWISWHTAVEGDLVYAYGRDVTAHKAATEELLQTHAALEASQARLLSMFETSYQLIGMLEPDGRVIDVNATALAAIEGRREDVVGRPFWETPWFTATPGMPEQIRAAVLAAARGESMRREMTGNVAAGPRTYDFSMRPVRDRHGAVIAIVPESLDVTERRQTEEALRQSQKMEAVGQLTGGLAHDFNNLLTGITGSLELLQTRLAQGRLNDLERYITAAQGASRRAAALTHRLLAFSRPQTLDPKATEVDRLVAGMEELIRRTAAPRSRSR